MNARLAYWILFKLALIGLIAFLLYRYGIIFQE
jgi:hypothetical protein